jgi:hypothetical protein
LITPTRTILSPDHFTGSRDRNSPLVACFLTSFGLKLYPSVPQSYGLKNPFHNRWAKLGRFGNGRPWSICEHGCHPEVINERWFWAFLLLYKASMGNFLTLAMLLFMDGRTLMLTEGLDTIESSAIALILVLLTARIMKRKHGGFFKSSRGRNTPTNDCAADRLFESKRIPALKPCPTCAEQLPLSALLCPRCDYNFLAERPGRGQKLLPPPQPMTHEVSEQRIASAGL